MKIFILEKKVLLSICLFFFVIFSIYLSLYNPFSMAIEPTTDNAIDDEFKNNIATLTKSDEKIAYLTFDDGPT